MSPRAFVPAALLLLAALLPGAAPAVPAGEPAGLAPGWRWVATADGTAEPRAPAMALLDALAAPAQPVSAAARLLASAAGALAGGAAARVPRGPADAGYPGFASADLQGDVTGDGASEVLLVQFPAGGPDDGGAEPHRFRVLAAPDGRELWVREVDGVFVAWAPAVDLDGDAAPDVLALALEHTGAPLALPGGPVVQRFTWRLLALAGADGATMWEASESWAYALQPGGGFAGSVASPAFFYRPILGPDADGDGGLDVWLNVLDTAALRGQGNAVADARVDRFTLLSGATGEPMGALALPAGMEGYALVFPAGDVTGDGRGDSLVNLLPAAFGSPAGTLVLAAEASGAPVWGVPFPGALAVALPFPDLTGDAAADALVVVVEQGDVDLRALSGADGAALWSIEEPLFLGFAAGNLDGQAGQDLVFLDGDASAAGLAPRVQGVAGDSGAVLYDEHPFVVPIPPGGYASVEFRPRAGDVDGDGAQDTILNAANGVFPEQFTGDVHAVRSADGRDHVVLRGQAYEGRPGGDLTGDGRDDLLRLLTTLEPYTLVVAGVDASGGAVAWERAVAGTQGVTLLGGGDLGGGAAQDVLALAVAETGGGPDTADTATLLEAWDGPTGAVLWRAP